MKVKLKFRKPIALLLALMMGVSMLPFTMITVSAATATYQWWDLRDAARYGQTSEPTLTNSEAPYDASAFGGSSPFSVAIKNPDGTATTVTGTQYWAWSVGNPTSMKQRLRIYVPNTATANSAILHGVNNASWFSNDYPSFDLPATIDLTVTDNQQAGLNSQSGLAALCLERGMILLVDGARSRQDFPPNSPPVVNPEGKSPATVADTKAALRFLRANIEAGNIPGNSNEVFVSGTSGGGALSTILCATGNSTDYFPTLYASGAAGMTSATASTVSDAYRGTIAYCPITDMPMGDGAYEFTYNAARQNFNQGFPALADGSTMTWTDLMTASDFLAQQYVSYVNGLGLKDAGGATLTASYTSPTDPQPAAGVTGGTYKTAMIALLEKSLEKGINDWDNGLSTGFRTLTKLGLDPMVLLTDPNYQACVQVTDPSGTVISPSAASIPAGSTVKITDFTKYCELIPGSSYKSAPAFDNQGTPDQAAIYNENNLTGSASQMFSHWDEYAWNIDLGQDDGVGLGNTGLTFSQFLASNTGQAVALQAKTLSPIPYLLNGTGATMPAIYQVGSNKSDVAPYWYVRHGSMDCDTSFANQTTLYYALVNCPGVNQGKLNFNFAYGQLHDGNYDTLEAVAWLDSVLKADSAISAALAAPVYSVSDPKAPVMQGDVCKMVINSLNITDDSAVAAISAGLNADATVTRVQAAGIIATALEQTAKAPTLSSDEINALLSPFTDMSGLSDVQRGQFAECVKLGIFVGDGTGTMAPNANLLRSQLDSLAAKLHGLQ